VPTPHAPSALRTENLTIPQGATESATWPTPWLWAEGDDPAPPAGWDTDGGDWVARLQIRDHYGTGATLLATLSSDPGETDRDGVLVLDTSTEPDADGNDVTWARITPSVTADTSAAWAWTQGVWDLELTNGSRVVRLVEGRVQLSGEATLDA
jgi:hypothetical protein